MAEGLQTLVNQAKDAFIAAKADGKLDAGEVIQIASVIAKGIQKMDVAGLVGGVSGAEKKAFVLLALKRGLDAAGGLPGIGGASPETLAAFEKQLFSAAGAALDVVVAHGALGGPGGLVALLAPLFQLCKKSVKAALPKDQELLHQALDFVAGKVAPAIQESADQKVEEIPVQSEDKKEEDKSLETQSEKESSPAPLVEEPPVSVDQVVVDQTEPASSTK